MSVIPPPARIVMGAADCFLLLRGAMHIERALTAAGLRMVRLVGLIARTHPSSLQGPASPKRLAVSCEIGSERLVRSVAF